MSTNYRTQSLTVQTGKQKRRIFAAIIAALLVLAGILVVIGIRSGYKPPAFDASATTGVPTPDEGYLYDTVSTNFGYEFRIAANLYQQEDGSVNAFFTNPSSNEVYLVCEILAQESGDTLYKTGVIRPGEYVSTIPRYRKFANEKTDITVTVYAFDPDTWRSEGTTTIDTVLQPW